MKRFLLNLTKFLGVTIIAYIILVIVYGTVAPGKLKTNLLYILGGYGNLYTRLHEADTTKNVDVLFLGTSHAYRGYDTRIFNKAGLKVFNLGSSAQSPIQTEYLVKKYIDRLNPKFVVFDVYPLVLGSDGIESSLDLISNHKLDGQVLKMGLKANNAKVYNTLIFSYFRQTLSLDNHFKEARIKGPDTYIGSGYIENNRVFKGGDVYKQKAYTISDSQMQAFSEIITLLKAKHIPYILVQAPIYKALYKSVTNNNTIDLLMSRYGSYKNFNNQVALTDSMYADESHLNQTGVNVYDAEFLKYLKSNIVFKSSILRDKL